MNTDMPIGTDYQLFNPVAYLNQYFYATDVENNRLIRFFTNVVHTNDLDGASMLDFGCGPVILAVISFCRKCAEIHMGDYLEKNLEQVRWWLEEADQCFNWDPFIRHALECEALAEVDQMNGSSSVSVLASAVAARSALMRQKVTRLLPGDACNAHPVGPEGSNRYDVLVSSFCLEAITKDIGEWQVLVANISTMLKPGGLLVMNTVLDSVAYGVGDRYFATCNISKQVLLDTIVQAGYQASSIEIEEVQAIEPKLIYQGFAMLTARKQTL